MQIPQLHSEILVLDNKISPGVSVVVAEMPRWVPDSHASH